MDPAIVLRGTPRVDDPFTGFALSAPGKAWLGGRPRRLLPRRSGPATADTAAGARSVRAGCPNRLP